MSTTSSRVVTLAVGALLVAAVAGTAGYWVGHTPPPRAVAERKVLYWYDPMSPGQKFAKPGKSPFMDMPLVPRYADTTTEATAPGVQLDPIARQNLGVRLARVERTPVADQQSVTGTIGYNQRDVAVIQARAAGFVERGYGRAPGDVLAAGAPLADLLLPAWDGALAEYLGVRRLGDAALTAAARQRLRLLGLSDAAIARADANGSARATTTITTPIGGALQTLDVRPGMAVAAGQTLAQVNGLGRVWLDAAVPEAMAGRLAVGQHARAELTACPDVPVTGRIAAILPATQPDSRTLTVRIELPNPGGRLRPGMFARVMLGSAAQFALTVPSEAVIRTGTRTLAMVAGEHGSYRPAEVRVGREAGGRTVIEAGLAEGEQVVASGQFLLDSEASLRGLDVRPIASTPPAAAALPVTHARVEAVDDTSVTLSHDAIPALAWPAMTMAFKLASPGQGKGLHPGDEVMFSFDQKPDGPVIHAITPMGAAK